MLVAVSTPATLLHLTKLQAIIKDRLSLESPKVAATMCNFTSSNLPSNSSNNNSSSSIFYKQIIRIVSVRKNDLLLRRDTNSQWPNKRHLPTRSLPSMQLSRSRRAHSSHVAELTAISLQ